MSYSKTFDLYLANEAKNQDPGSSIDFLAESYGDDIFQRLLNSLLNKDLSQQQATDLWRAAMHSFNNDNSRMNWRSVVLDYLVTRTELLKNPRIVDAEELKQLRTDAVTDGLTNLYNQSHFKQRLTSIIQEHKARTGSVFSLIILDLDRFKQFNDRCGHLRGDHALEKIGRLICSQLPNNALAARYGGEEFMVITPGKSPDVGAEISERVRAFVAETPVEAATARVRLTASFGVSSAGPAVFPDVDTLIHAADAALYRAKDAGRNSTSLSG